MLKLLHGPSMENKNNNMTSVEKKTAYLVSLHNVKVVLKIAK